MGDEYSYVGAVVGATYPEMGKVLRKVMPKIFILVPGYGAQGGKGADLVHFFNEDGLGAIVNSSRGIIAAYKQEEYANFGEEAFADASRAAVEDMIADIRRRIERQDRKKMADKDKRTGNGMFLRTRNCWMGHLQYVDSVQRQLQSMPDLDSLFLCIQRMEAKLLPRPISICEIDKEDSRLRLVYRVTGENTGTEEFSRVAYRRCNLESSDLLEMDFHLKRLKERKYFLWVEELVYRRCWRLAKQLKCDKKQIVVGYRDAQTFLKEEFEQNGELYIATERWKCRNKGKCYGCNP